MHTPIARRVAVVAFSLMAAPLAAQPAVTDRPPLTIASAAANVDAPRRADPDYVVGARDVLAVTVWNQPGLSGKFTVESDGSFAYPLLGRMTGAGLTPRAIETALTERLADGFLATPEVSVSVEEFRSQRIFVMGEVRQPGPYPLSGRTTLIEVLALVRSTTAEASKTAIIVHSRTGNVTGPTLPTAGEQPDVDITRVDLEALEMGDLSRNIELKNGDTVFVPRAETVVVFGQVRTPGVYPISGKTTVVELLAHAGGITDRGAANRVKIQRTVNGKQVEVKARLEDVVKPGDRVIVPERLF